MKTILCACVIALITLKGEAMRSVNFRDDVLHVVADKLGIDPEQSNFLTNEAIPLGKFIDQWVRRTYDARDWPEWTVTEQFAPVNHIVTWDTTTGTIGGNITKKIGRVLKVFLVDPATTDAPVDTPFTLRDDGIHCGYEHGTYVWIRYIAPPPRFTAISWRPDFTYGLDDTVYSYTTGECYKSKVNGNLNHDPVSAPRPSPPHLGVEEIQALVPGDSGTIAAPQIWDVLLVNAFNNQPVADPMPNGDEFTITIEDTLGAVLSAHSIMADGVTSNAAMLAALKVQCDADALPGFTFTVFGADKKMRIQSTTTEFVVRAWNYLPASASQFILGWIQIQPLLAGTPATEIVPQQIKLTMGDGEFLPGALYTLTFTDNDGTEHSVEYQSNVFDNRNQIFNGLALAMGASPDLTIANASASINTSEPSMTISIIRRIGVDAPVRPPGSQYWTLIPFPKALADQVIRGAYSDLLKEWGQTDKGAAEEQAVPAEAEISAGDFAPMPNPPMTGQQAATSRYKL